MADGTTVTSLPHTVLYAVVDLHEGMRGTENPIIEPCSELSRLRSLLAQAEFSLNAIENLCALNPRLADGEVHHTAMWALAAVREGRR